MMYKRKVLLTALLGIGLCGASVAHGGGGRGGGDSSMNPYTGDSYAYFHGGHNLGEEGFNIPWRKAAPNTAPAANNTPNATARAPAATTKGTTKTFRPLPDSGPNTEK